ncbi:hypothetical protein AGABI1DRAFT_115040 [Agaricus bisporus var. burnettii JB137-S8]|uniref:MOSC domain-containing protein n=1 Tax=Agaricus bisporus var. burnettii (strain JB137-S8 / ATCC MYA-4627 / FGSC 10392) TaxID=597362 RepID=K5XS74_AGABU|nr:uncharacterized protein AGABI1DRAFT_115040 [Agaricus bisporus var. burnettii JB137-S8]EKM77780.1 hypothetical protein AGABI1DRAFT_115040 [Agaricus bisporus var. burnettii JB137-S8]
MTSQISSDFSYAGLLAAAVVFLAFSRTVIKAFKGRNSIPRTGRLPPQDGIVKVAKIFVHPIKSCRGTSVERVKYTEEGLENDRFWCVIDAETHKVITAREAPKLVLIRPLIQTDSSSSPGEGSLVVTFPDDAGYETFTVPLRPSAATLKTWTMLTDIIMWSPDPAMDGYICPTSIEGSISPSDIMSRYIGKPVHLVYKGPAQRASRATYEFPDLKSFAHYQDMYPMMMLSEENLAVVEEEARPLVGKQGVGEKWKDATVKVERFRPNIVFRGAGAFGEDDWEEISIGSKGAPSITLVSKTARCLLPNVDPDTGIKDAAVPYKVMMKFRKGIDPADKMKPCFGCNGVPKGEGEMKVGDTVYVKKMW